MIAPTRALVLSLLTAAVLSPNISSSQGGEKRHRLPWSLAQGRPRIDFGRAVGIYIWHEGNVVHIVSSDNKPNGQVVNGTIRLRGKGMINAIGRQHDEKEDRTRMKPNAIRFRLDTHTGSDGLTFGIQGGQALAVDFDQPGRMDRNVYIGAGQRVVNGGILVFDLDR